MSSLAATTSAVYCSVCEAIAKFVKNTYYNFLFARQCSANKEAAEALARSGEYRGQTMHQIWYTLNQQALEEYKKNVSK